MRRCSILRRSGILLGLAVLLTAGQGCTYLQHRAEDFAEMMDIGITLSAKPGLAAYADGVSVLAGGFSYIDGYFLGWGGGQVGWTRHYEVCWGLLVLGHETQGWGEFDKSDPKTLSKQFVGALGLPVFPFHSRPDYMPSCVHTLHVGFIGVIANARYMEMIDFVLGWTTLDIGGDDGKPIGKWPWKSH